MNKGDEIIKGTYGQIVKEVRGRLFLSQEAFAKEIGVCSATLNRWEKGNCIPSFLRKQLFKKFCDSKGIQIEEQEENDNKKKEKIE